ncbi:MAG: amidase [Deltaproteobacteria bacterium]|nr:amidase [Deltaproteobacteria bacterium]
MTARDSLCALSAVQQSKALAQKETTSRELTEAHLARIDRLNPKLNAFCAVFHERALADADASDARRKSGDPRGPLDGVPVSVKECFDLEGQATTLGLTNRKDHKAPADAALVQLVREAGGVILGRTNNPQLLLSHETRNPVFGQTNNPWSLGHVPGGSSGGESSAIAAGLSPLGLGSDLGGSIRVPAHFTGIAGLKPTLDRWPWRGGNTGITGQEAVRGMAGPMARTSEDLGFFMGALDPARMTELDPRVPPLPWVSPSTIDVRKLRVGVVRQDFLVKPSPAVTRALDEAAAHLRAFGCDVIDFEIPDLLEGIARYSAALSSDGGKTLAGRLAGGVVDPMMAALLSQVRVPNTLRRVLAMVLRRHGDDALATVFSRAGERSLQSYYKLTADIRAYRFTVLDAMAKARVELLLTPPFATPALEHLTSGEFLLGGTYAMLFNELQLPAGTAPVTRVRDNELAPQRTQLRLEKVASRIDAKSKGLPVGVQVVGRPWAEAQVLAAMQVVEEGARAGSEFPRTPVEL